MHAKDILSLLKQTFAEWSEDKAMRLAAALACYTIISLAPLVVITLKVLSWVIGADRATNIVQNQMGHLMGTGGTEVIRTVMTNAAKPGAGVVATIISFVILLFSASGVFAELQDSMNTIWEVKPRPNLPWWDTIRKRVLSVGMVFAIIFLLLVSMFITAALGVVVDHITGVGASQAGFFAKAVSYVTDFIVTTVVVWLLFTLIFRYLPDVRLGWRDVSLGAVVTAVLFKLGQYALAIYFYKAAPTSAYGAVGSVVAVLLWAYYSACILFFGGEFTQVYTKRQARPIKPDAEAVPVTDEERAQQGIPRSGDLALASAAQTSDRAINPAYAHAAAIPQRRVVTITRPTLESSGAQLLAGAGLASGFVVGALGLLAGRKYTHMGVEEVRLQQRLDRVESVLGKGKQLQRRAMELNIVQRLDDMERRFGAVRRNIRHGGDHRPQWAKRLAEFVRPD